MSVHNFTKRKEDIKWTQIHLEQARINMPPDNDGEIQDKLIPSILDAVPHAVIGLRDLTIFFANGAVESVFGWKPNELIGKTAHLLYKSDEDYEQMGNFLYPDLDDHRTHQTTFTYRHRQGHTITCRVHVSRIGDKLKDNMFVVTYEDITEQHDKENNLRLLNENLDSMVQQRTAEVLTVNAKLQKEIETRIRSEEKLRRSEQEKRAILDSMSEHVLLLDKDMKIIWSNMALQKYFNMPPEKIAGRYCFEALYNKSATCSSCPSLKAIQTGQHQEYERIDSAGKIWTFRGNPVFDGKGAVIGAVEIVTNITERKSSEEALRQSEARYRDIIENMDDGYFENDLQGNFTFVNEAMIRIYGYSREELLRLNHREYTTQLEAKRIFKAYNELYQTGIPVKIFDYEIIRKDGEIRQLEVSTSLVYDKFGHPVSFRGIDRDVTERKKMEEEKKKLTKQLNQAQKMEAIGTLAGGIAHDFNNLLMGIQGYTSLMMLMTDPLHPHFEKLKAIETQVQSGADLTKQLLGFARGGRYEVNPTDMNALISKTATMFGRTKKEIRIQEKYAANLWIVDSDRGQMEQVMLNLFVNAWQAMPGGGTLYLETQNIMLDESYLKPYDVHPGPYTKISVTDTGVGMDEKTLQRIFDPFFTTKEMGRGTGLGLASAYGIIKGHGGFINVYSEKGHGTTFNIYIPASHKELIKQDATSSDVVRGQETILMVDDEKVITDVTSAMLEGLGYHVLIAHSGEEAVEMYQQYLNQIDLVIMDMIMPGIGGGGAFDAIKTIHPEARVILSSGYSMNGMAKDILNRGVRAFLQKPFRLSDLSQKIREVLETRP